MKIFGEGTLKNELMSLSKANSLELQINKPVSNKALLKVLNNYKVLFRLLNLREILKLFWLWKWLYCCR